MLVHFLSAKRANLNPAHFTEYAIRSINRKVLSEFGQQDKSMCVW